MNTASTEEIIKQCRKETKIVYANNGGFFTPRLKSINHLEIGESKIIDNPLTIALELLFLEYTRIRNRLAALRDRWFPRHEKISGYEKDAYLIGKLTFKSKDPNRKPIGGMKIILWARTKLFQWRRLADGYTNEDGSFRLDFDLYAAVNSANRKYLTLEVQQIENIQYDQKGEPYRVFSVFHREKFPKAELTGMGYNLREIQLNFWNYRGDSKIPRTLLQINKKDRLQTYTRGRFDALYEQIIPIELTKRKHLRQLRRASHKISYKSIQADYPINFTQSVELKLPGYTRGDEWFGERMMNGMYCAAFMPANDGSGEFLVKYFGHCDYEHNDIYALPDAIIRFKLDENGLPIPIKITLRGALSRQHTDPWQEHQFSPESGDMLWKAAKRVARSTANVCAEMDQHFYGTHLNVEQYAIAVNRNFRQSPLAVLMIPHMREVSLINEGADQIIVNGFMPSGTAMIAPGLVRRAEDLLGMMDWNGWKPMEPISAKHSYALAETLYWQVTSDFVDEFFRENLDGIIRHWDEAYGFSDDLVKHSVPVFLSDKNLTEMSEPLRNQYLERFSFYKFQYAFNDEAARETIAGERKVLSRITNKKRITADDAQDIDNMKQACKYAIMQATFMHSWINEHQYDELGEVLYSSGGLKFGDKESGVLVPEDDVNVAPDLNIATQQLWFANFLSRTEYGFITKNEDGDVNPAFREMLLAKRAEFEAIGVDIDDIESRTNI